MHIADLSANPSNPRRLYVGWLDKDHEYARGEVSSEFSARLLRLCSKAMKTRGFHRCPFCPGGVPAKPLNYRKKAVSLGSGFFSVKGKRWLIFEAPDLIYHYVVDHGYKPPAEFIEAVMYPRRILTLDSLVLIWLALSASVIACTIIGLRTLGLWLLGCAMTSIFALLAILLLDARLFRILRKQQSPSASNELRTSRP